MKGPRPVNLQTDLGAIADLVELCFQDHLDAAGRSVIREMRFLSRLGPVLWLLQGLNKVVKGLAGGFVWVEDGQLVGNVSLYRAEAGTPGWIIANVAVHPDYRRRGIARCLMKRSLGALAGYGARWGDLQVRHDNLAALSLYRALDFVDRGTWMTWRRPSGVALPALAETANVRETRGAEWQKVYELARQVRPEGLGWLRPLARAAFRPRLGEWLRWSHRTRFWVSETGEPAAGAVLVDVPGGRRVPRLTLIVRPEHRGCLEKPLLLAALHHLFERGVNKSVAIEHPEDDVAAASALEQLGFGRRQTLTQMRYRFAPEAAGFRDSVVEADITEGKERG